MYTLAKHREIVNETYNQKILILLAAIPTYFPDNQDKSEQPAVSFDCPPDDSSDHTVTIRFSKFAEESLDIFLTFLNENKDHKTEDGQSVPICEVDMEFKTVKVYQPGLIAKLLCDYVSDNPNMIPDSQIVEITNKVEIIEKERENNGFYDSLCPHSYCLMLVLYIAYAESYIGDSHAVSVSCMKYAELDTEIYIFRCEDEDALYEFEALLRHLRAIADTTHVAINYCPPDPEDKDGGQAFFVISARNPEDHLPFLKDLVTSEAMVAMEQVLKKERGYTPHVPFPHRHKAGTGHGRNFRLN